MRAAGAVAGQVTDENEYPIEGALVGAGGFYDTTDSNGKYFIDNLVTGLNPISFDHPCYTGLMTTVNITHCDTFVLDVVMEEAGSIEGTVTNVANDSLEGVVICVEAYSLYDTTDSNGYYQLYALEPGTYDISFTHPDYEETTVVDFAVECDTILDVVMNSRMLFEYLPGDVNMANGEWPPRAIGADVTYLVGYFRAVPISLPCYMHNPNAAEPIPGRYLWASADANGDCLIIGSDVTKLVNYFRGIGTILWCGYDKPDKEHYYEPLWHTPDELPEDPPPGWPNCQPQSASAKALPSGIGGE